MCASDSLARKTNLLDWCTDQTEREQMLLADAQFRRTNPEPYFCLGMLYKDQQKLEQARDAFEKSLAIKVTPEAAWSLFQVCSQLSDFFKMAEAKRILMDLGFSTMSTSTPDKSKGGEIESVGVG